MLIIKQNNALFTHNTFCPMPALECWDKPFLRWQNLQTPLSPSSRITTSTGLQLSMGSKPDDPCYFS